MDDRYHPMHMYMNSADPGASEAIVAGLAGLFFIFVLVLSYVVCAFLLGRIFKKAGVPQWIAWVPVYNIWRFLELGGQSGFWSLFTLVPFFNLVGTIFIYIAAFNVGKKFGKDDWFVLLAIFLPVIWLIWLAFDDSEWPAHKPKSTHKKPPARKKPATRRKSA